MTQRRRIILTGMALLDAICLGRFLDTIQFDYLQHQAPLWVTVLHSIHIILLGSLLASAYGLAMERRWALWLSYVQFPARAIHITLSFGWLTLLGRCLGYDSYCPLLYTAIALELVRLAATILVHRSMRRKPS